MMQPIFINGRFTTQAITGVQRFACEITAALLRVWPTGSSKPVVLSPPIKASGMQPPTRDDSPVRYVGVMSGHAWEQFELPRASSPGVLINLGNTAPIFAKNQIVVIHDAAVFASPDAYSWKFRLAYKGLHRALLRSRSRIVTVSEFSRSQLIYYLGGVEYEIDVIREGADHIHALPGDYGYVAAQGLTRGDYVLVVGSLAQHKNLPVLTEAARRLAARGKLLVVAGDLDSRVFEQVKASLPQPARYIGRVSDAQLRALYDQALCFVFPSTYEGFGLPAVEAMLCGCPVVASNIPALAEVCGNAALFCDPLSPDQFADAVIQISNDPVLAKQLSEAGRIRASGFTWDAAAQALLEVVWSENARSNRSQSGTNLRLEASR